MLPAMATVTKCCWVGERGKRLHVLEANNRPACENGSRYMYELGRGLSATRAVGLAVPTCYWCLRLTA